eukprot:scaffold39560_cov64-Phaeocystis_antarctica.AAC.1
MLLAALQLSQIVCMLVTRTPLWRDPIENKDTSFQKAMTRTAMPRSLGSVRWMHIAPHTYPSSLSTRTFKALCLAPLYHLYHYTRLGRCMGVTDPAYLYCALGIQSGADGRGGRARRVRVKLHEWHIWRQLHGVPHRKVRRGPHRDKGGGGGGQLA